MTEWIDTGIEPKLVHVIRERKLPQRFRICKDDEVIKDFIACKSPDGEVGYYETVVGKFYSIDKECDGE